MNRKSLILGLLGVLGLLTVSCAGNDDRNDNNDYSTTKTSWSVDLDAANANWGRTGDEAATTVDDLYSVNVVLSEDNSFLAPTHLFGPVNVIPYSDSDNVKDADGTVHKYGDSVIAEYFTPGKVGYAIKNHRAEYPTMKVAPGANIKEDIKFQDTHIEIVVGIEYEDGHTGAMTVNNPQTYQKGRFGTPQYPMIFVEPVFPDYLSQDQKVAFNDNIRTMLLGFNAVSDFPGDYNGGDPLAAHSPEKVREHVAMMIKAITGDASAKAFFEDPANQIYCAELAHVSSSAGLLVPLNKKTVVDDYQLVDASTWEKFVAEIDKHNRGESSTFQTMNKNTGVKYIKATLAPEDLKSCALYSSDAEEQTKLAFEPMTMADMVEQFMKHHIPRKDMGEEVAPAQGALLAAMKPGVLESMGMDSLPETDPKRQAVDALYQKIVDVVSVSYSDYNAFRDALEPLLAEARVMTGPRPGDESGTGLFVPPSLLHMTALGEMQGGLLDLNYLGHGLHFSLVRKAGSND